jgi:5'-3' exonuclease
MVEFEADDALATAVKRFGRSRSVEQIVLCSPDKDLAQLVTGQRVVGWDRRRDVIIDEAGVVAKYGVPPASIPDYLALVGDAADGFPGLPGWGAKSASVVLARFGHLESIPADAAQWDVAGITPGRAATLAASLAAGRHDALLFRKLATLRMDVPLSEKLADLQWRGAHARLKSLCAELGDEKFPDRLTRWR